MGRWIVDFACLNPRIVIEVDDTSHDWRDERERTGYLEALGFVVLRFTNKEVAQDLEDVVTTICRTVEALRQE